MIQKLKKKTIWIPLLIILIAVSSAVIKFSGRSSDKNFEKHNKILKQKLLDDKISIKGSAIRATYNSPFTLPPLRRNESMFSIDWKN